jgi:hypothetical protein
MFEKWLFRVVLVVFGLILVMMFYGIVVVMFGLTGQQ